MKLLLILSICATFFVACNAKPPSTPAPVQVARPPSQRAPEPATSAAAPAPPDASGVSAGSQPMPAPSGAAPLPASAYESGGTGEAAAKKWDRQRKWMDQLKSGGATREQAMREINALTTKDRSDFQRICKAYGIELK